VETQIKLHFWSANVSVYYPAACLSWLSYVNIYPAVCADCRDVGLMTMHWLGL